MCVNIGMNLWLIFLLLCMIEQQWQSEKERLQWINAELEKQLEDVNKKNISIEEDDELEVVDDAWLKI